MKASGFAALREVASTSTAGFALFRRKRLIEGSLDEPYRPDFIFGTGNSYRKQRLIGEIHLEGFDVSHTKDGFKWEDHEQPFLEILYDELEKQGLPLLSQAEGYRARVAQRELRPRPRRPTPALPRRSKRKSLASWKSRPSHARFLSRCPNPRRPTGRPARDVIEVEHRGVKWLITIELAMDPAIEDWITVADKPAARGAPRDDHSSDVPRTPIHATILSRRFRGDRGAGEGCGSDRPCRDNGARRWSPAVRHHSAQP